MKEPNNHIDIDLEFLDKKEPLRMAPNNDSQTDLSHNAPASVSTGPKYNWKNILIIGGVVLFFSWVIFSEDESGSTNANNNSSSATQASQDNNIIVGDYSCSSYHYNQAEALNPDDSEQQINFARSDLENKGRQLDRLKSEIDSSYVSEYSSQYTIDQYNETVDEYNAKLVSYKREADNFSSRVDKYNLQIEKHNNYLESNCTKIRK